MTHWVVNGWTLFAHPLFLEQLERTTVKVEELRRKDPSGYLNKNASKRLAAINKLAFEVIPQNPTRSEYRQGETLGKEYNTGFAPNSFSSIDCSFVSIRKAKLSFTHG